ncbi:MAG: substrate-binding domain-containing protein [Phycisphaeraceae bacterium JB051]
MTLEVIKRSEPIYKQIAAHYQDQIARGVLCPGDSLPNTLDLAKQFNVANQTAQNALKELSNRGLIKRVPKLGSFVSEHLNANTMAVVCGRSLISEPDVKTYAQTTWQISNHLSRNGWNAKVYTPVCQPLEKLMIRELERDVQAGLIKAILVVNMSSQLGPWLNKECKIPWTYASGRNEKNVFSSQYGLMTEMGIDYLIGQGYRNIGLMISKFEAYTPKRVEAMVEDMKVRGKEVGNIQYIRPANNAPQSGMKAISQWVKSRQPIPDALFVFDDNLTSGVILGLLANDLKYPEKIGLLTHANRGIDILSPVPLTRIEMDPIRMAIHNTDNLLRRLNGEPSLDCVPDLRLVPGESCGEKKPTRR